MPKAKLTASEFLLQGDILSELLPNFGKKQWQVLFQGSSVEDQSLTIWCALLEQGAVAQALKQEGWDLQVGQGGPGFSQYWPKKGKRVTEYHRYSHSRIRPLVLSRSFHGAYPDYWEIDEEFRLYHNLAEDKVRSLLLAFDSSGREIEVVRLASRKVEAQLKYLRQFQAGLGLHLAIYVDSVRYSKIPLSEIPASEHQRQEKTANSRWRRNVVKCDFREGFQSFSRVLAKVILPPPAMEEAGIWPFEPKEEQKDSFIIGTDENGKNIEFSSNPDKLSNYFGANPGAPNYLTPVFFRREVLNKYFSEPHRYKVSDGMLRCCDLWSCQIDNDLPSRVVVFLGDLGRDLPFDERLHWRQFNMPPEGGISETNIRRSFLAQFTDPKSPDLVFREEYHEFKKDWPKALGWSFFLDPSKGDEHLLNTVRVPVTESQSEFDEQVGHLAKLLVDSLNEKELMKRGAGVDLGSKGIAKLESFLKATNCPETEMIVGVFRGIQALRSTGSAHRKGTNYSTALKKLEIDNASKQDGIRKLLTDATAAIRLLKSHFCKKAD